MTVAKETAKEIVGVLLPLLCILALVAVLLSAMMHADHQLEAAALTQMTSSSSSTLSQFFNDLFHVYDLTRRWVLSSALLPINASVQEPNATLDFTHTTWEYGAYDIIQGHPEIVGMYFTDPTLLTLESTREAGLYYIMEYEQPSLQRERIKTVQWGQNYNQAVQGNWYNATLNPAATAWYTSALLTRASPNWTMMLTDLGTSSYAYDSYIKWNGPYAEIFLPPVASVLTVAPLVDLSWRVDWPSASPAAGQFAVFRLELAVGHLDDAFANLNLPSAACAVAVVTRNGTVLNTGNKGKNFVLSQDQSSATMLQAWQTTIPGVNLLRAADLTNTLLDSFKSFEVDRGGYAIRISPVATAKDWRLVVALRESDVNKTLHAWLAAANAVAALAFIIIILRSGFSIWQIFRHAKEQKDIAARGERLT